jgi:hypothetical protein
MACVASGGAAAAAVGRAVRWSTNGYNAALARLATAVPRTAAAFTTESIRAALCECGAIAGACEQRQRDTTGPPHTNPEG